MKRKTSLFFTTLPSLFLPFYVSAQSFDYFDSLVGGVGEVISLLIPVLVGIALIVFLWGLVVFIGSEDDDKKNEGRNKMVWGIITLFVIVAVWGIVVLFQELLGVNRGNVLTPPEVLQ